MKNKIIFITAITLFVIIFITAFIFTQLFVNNNRNIQLQELAVQNNKFILFIENNYNNNKELLDFIKDSGNIKKLENIIGTKIAIIDANLDILLNPLGLPGSNFKDLLLSKRQIGRFFTLPILKSIRNNSSKLMDFEIAGNKYYVSVNKFILDDGEYYSLFFKKSNEITIPPVRYFMNLIFIFIIAALISIITGIMLGNNISKPILKLNKSVSKISNGDYGENIDIKSYKEINALARNINVMKNKIQKSQDSLKDFTYMLSHEIKNMLTSINGYAIGINDGVYSTQQEIDDAIKIIINKTKDLENMTESLLMLSKIENKIVELSKEEINIESTVDDLLKLYEPECTKNNLRISKFTNLKPDLKLFSDKYLLQTILSNLINNAIKYATPDSEIVVNINSNENFITLSVANEGYAISEDEKDKIFNLFYRSKKYDFKNIKGFGLGLAIAKKISGILGARLNFKTSGKINTFKFEIPI
ncbi:MAG: HAMP domain-containing histidine kinase [Actinobacteria bacterium]|nr:HAMP domain-containing histidine kinase [Actinomycetota bacterium]